MKRLRILVLCFVILISEHLKSQEKYLYFKYDSIPIWQNDSVILIEGDSFNSTVKTIWKDFRKKEYCINNGFLTKSLEYNMDNFLMKLTEFNPIEKNYKKTDWYEKGVIHKIEKGNENMDSFWIYSIKGSIVNQGQYINDSNSFIVRYEEIHNRVNIETGVIEKIFTFCNKCHPPHGDWLFYNRDGKYKTFKFDRGVIQSIELGTDEY